MDNWYDKIYEVVSPEYIVYSQTEIEPAEYDCDVVYVEARNKKEAKVKGVAKFRRLYPDGYVSDGDNPFKGLQVSKMFDCDIETLEYFIEMVKK